MPQFAEIRPNGLVSPAELGTGVHTSSTVLHGDQVYRAPAGGGSPPTGTGFRHVTGGAEDAAAKLVETADVDASLKDAAAATVSMRTLGTGAAQACAGDDARLSDARTPTTHGDSAHDATVASLASGKVPTSELGTGTPDGTKYLRDDQTWAVPPAGGSPPTGTGFRHVTAGVEDAATKLVESADVHANLKDAAAGTASLRTLGTAGTAACAGNDARLSDARTPTSHGDSAHDATVASLSAGKVPTSELGTGTADATTYLRGDQSWAVPPAGGGAPTLISGNSGAANSGAAPSETWQHLTADATANATTTFAVVMTTTGLAVGTYLFEYYIVWRSSLATVGVKFAVDYTGTSSRYVATRHDQTTGAAAATGVTDGDSATLTGQLVEHWSTRTDGAALGPNTGVDTINVDQFSHIRGILVATGAGNLELEHASEAANSTQVMANTMLLLKRLA